MVKMVRLFRFLLKAIGMAVTLALLSAVLLLGISKLGGETPLSEYSLKAVLSQSMTPTFDAGSLLLVQEVPEKKLQEGDIISFVPVSETVTHRIKRIEKVEGKHLYFTQGDANNYEDPGVVYDQIQGRVVFWLPILGNWLMWLQSDTSKMLVVLMFLDVVLLAAFVKLAFEIKNEKGKKHVENAAE